MNGYINGDKMEYKEKNENRLFNDDVFEKYYPYSVEIRRYFHKHPELSWKEYETQKKIRRELESMGLETHDIAGTGLYTYIEGKGPGRTIALRADIDALAIYEISDKEYISSSCGVMHACGHDGHISGLLTAARILIDNKENFNGRVKLIFQPAEEPAQGAQVVIKEGGLSDCDGIFGIHLWNEVETGKIAVREGALFAAATSFTINLRKRKKSEDNTDLISCTGQIISSLQSIVSREVNPLEAAVITCGKVSTLEDMAEIRGTTRCFDLDTLKLLEPAMRRRIEKISEIFDIDSEFIYEVSAIPTINEKHMTEIAEKTVTDVFGKEHLSDFGPIPIGEDFSYYGSEIPAMFVLVGTKQREGITYPHHHPSFDIEEDGMKYSALMYAGFALEFLKEEK